MARSQDTSIPFPGRFGRRQAPYTRMFRGSRARLNRSRQARRASWLLPWLTILFVGLYDDVYGSRLVRDLVPELPPPGMTLWVPDARPAATDDSGLQTAGEAMELDTESVQLVAIPAPSNDPVLAGRARAVDGDTLRIGGTPVHIDGIDAPELTQTCRHEGRPWRCGAAANALMRNLVEGRTVSCEDRGTDLYGRVIGLCRVDGMDVGAEMVSAGLALAYRHHSKRYIPEEIGARLERRGLWATEFEAPWEWRRGR